MKKDNNNSQYINGRRVNNKNGNYRNHKKNNNLKVTHFLDGLLVVGIIVVILVLFRGAIFSHLRKNNQDEGEIILNSEKNDAENESGNVNNTGILLEKTSELKEKGSEKELEDKSEDESDDNWNPIKETDYNGHKYAFFDGELTATEARNIKVEGYHLATITTEGENSHIISAIKELREEKKSTSEGFWVGADDVESEGEFKWITGEIFSFSQWPEGQPDNYDSKTCEPENYLGIWLEYGIWNDFKESYRLGYILEKEPSVEDSAE